MSDKLKQASGAARTAGSQQRVVEGRPWTHEEETREMTRPRRRTDDVNGTPYCRGCGMVASQCDCWDTVNGDI
ncbi:MAG: hypothetical protein KGL39_26445 [Patescibacteria group bacterium]|nr:hypothetical protein [Patescibacteria group bacterium]